MYTHLVDELRSALGEDAVKVMEPMKRYTTFRIGGPAEVLVTVTSPEQMCTAFEACKKASVEPLVIGNGSNLLVSDNGVKGVVIRFAPNGEEVPETLDEGNESALVYVTAGAMLSGFARKMTRRGLVGMEFAAGIPGSIGGGVVMNAGAYGGEIKDVIAYADVLWPDGTVERVENERMELSYRHSFMMDRKGIVLGAAFSLKKGDREASKAIIDELSAKRKEKQPLEYPSAGSTFKRPEGYFAGKLIQDAGLRGFTVGGAQVSEKHCGFVVNAGDATAEDVLLLMTRVRTKVYEENQVMLEPEVRMVGDFSELNPEIDPVIVQ